MKFAGAFVSSHVQCDRKVLIFRSCRKTYTTENAYRSHLNSKKHKENEAKAGAKAKIPPTQESKSPETELETKSSQPEPGPSTATTLIVNEDATEDEVAMTIDQKIAAARSRLSPQHCLFCTAQSASIDESLQHMAHLHSFWLPEEDYITDKPGLLTYLGEKVAVGNVCLYCNTRSREFRTLDAVRKHMVDKSHCKLAYEKDADKLELSDYYDFSSTHPNYKERLSRRAKKYPVLEEDEEWEDTDSDGEDADEVIDDSASESDLASDFGDHLQIDNTTYELVLPSGVRLGHRSLRRYYAQSFSPLSSRSEEDPKSGAAIVRKMLTDKDNMLVPMKGGFGAYGGGMEVVKARNRGEAKEAGRHVKEFRDQKRRENFKTKVGFRNNHQKHYRDPLLQVTLSSLPFFEVTVNLFRHSIVIVKYPPRRDCTIHLVYSTCFTFHLYKKCRQIRGSHDLQLPPLYNL